MNRLLAKPFVISALTAVLFLSLGGCSADAPSSRHKPIQPRGLPKTKPDAAAARRIVLSHPKSGERLDLVYYKRGAYDPAAMDSINRLFRDRRAGEIGEIDPELIDFMVDIRTRLGLPATVEFEILSGYRSPQTNAALARSNGKVATDSLHMRGYAVDFRAKGVHGGAIAEIAKTMQRGGVSFYPDDNHVHVDIGNIRTWKTSAK